MNLLVIFATVLFSINALSVEEQWGQFKVKHGKFYKTVSEEQLRFDLFKENLIKIKNHNEKYEAGLETWYMGVTKFADMNQEEFGSLLRRQNSVIPKARKFRHIHDPYAELPDKVDWRDKNAILEVKDQGKCIGSWWAFAVTGAIEGQNALLYNKSISLSEQQLLDCSRDYGNGGCDYRGDVAAAYEYILKNNITSEEVYPYNATDGSCKATNGTIVTIKSYKYVDQNEVALKEAVATVGPISIAIYAEPFQLYYGGVFQSDACYNNEYLLDHGVIVAGYGVIYNKKYWLLKNSWGKDWGENGFIRLSRDADQCGVALYATYPVL